jgi:hypothetical protein
MFQFPHLNIKYISLEKDVCVYVKNYRLNKTKKTNTILYI